MSLLSDKQLRNFRKKFTEGAPDECWEWEAGKCAGGYGRFLLGGKTALAHRIALALSQGLRGLPQSDVCALHSCDNPGCVNPNHLRWGSSADNARDREERGRSNPARGDANGSRLHPERLARGEANESATVPDALALEIVRRNLAGESQLALGREYGVSNVTISQWARGKKRPYLLEQALADPLPIVSGDVYGPASEADFQAPSIEGKVYGKATADDFKRGQERDSGTFRRSHLRLVIGDRS